MSTTHKPGQGATFRFSGRFTYPGAEQQRAALTSFASDSSLFHGPPIPASVVKKYGLELALDFERTTEVSTEWTGLLDQVAALAIGAKSGELIAVYDGFSASSGGRTVQRVRLRPGPAMDDPDEVHPREGSSRPLTSTQV
jgi:hypothetical protein